MMIPQAAMVFLPVVIVYRQRIEDWATGMPWNLYTALWLEMRDSRAPGNAAIMENTHGREKGRSYRIAYRIYPVGYREAGRR
jgi:hypothetical protein